MTRTGIEVDTLVTGQSLYVYQEIAVKHEEDRVHIERAQDLARGSHKLQVESVALCLGLVHYSLFFAIQYLALLVEIGTGP